VRIDGELYLGGVSLSFLARDRTDHRLATPAYVYSLDAIAEGARELVGAFDRTPHLVAYALKANSAAPVVRALAAAGCGADVVSGAELALALKCGIDARSIVFSGVAKLDDEIDAALNAGGDGIASVQMESVEEIARVAARVRNLGGDLRARVSFRINPGLDKGELGTHDGVATGHDEAKFGIALADLAAAREAVAREPRLSLVGIASHVGSQLTSVEPYAHAARHLFALAKSLRPSSPDLRFVDCGGGFGVDYGEGCDVRPADFVRAALAARKDAGLEDLHLYIEPGRSLVAAHGVLLATTIQEKRGSAGRTPWLFIDAGMNDLVRPAMYGSRHRIVALEDDGTTARGMYKVAGPVCESSDDFGLHELPQIAPKNVAILDAGAYGFTMASEYNGRALPAEIFLRSGTIVQRKARAATAAWVDGRA
jgi:diaminopimelate decarboxylase